MLDKLLTDGKDLILRAAFLRENKACGKPCAFLIAAALLAISGLAKHAPPTIHVESLYAILVALIAYHFGLRWGFIVSILACISSVTIKLCFTQSPDFISVHVNAILEFFEYAVVGYISDELSRRTKYTKDLLDRDPLTKLHTSAAFKAVLDNQVTACKKLKVPFTICYLNIEDFSSLNEKLGKSNCDHILRQFSKQLVRKSHATATVARIAGPHFAVLYPNLSYECSKPVLLSLVKNLHDFLKEKDFPVTLEIKATTVTPTVKSDSLLASLDSLLIPGFDSTPVLDYSDIDNSTDKGTIKHTLYYYV